MRREVEDFRPRDDNLLRSKAAGSEGMVRAPNVWPCPGTGHLVVDLTYLERVRDRLRIQVALARLLEREPIGRAPALSRQRIRDREQPEFDRGHPGRIPGALAQRPRQGDRHAARSAPADAYRACRLRRPRSELMLSRIRAVAAI